MSNEPIVRFSNVSFSYGDELVLQDLSFTLAEGERIALVGASGTGKSTILHLLAGSRKPTAGRVYVDPVVMRSRVLMVQTDGLLPWYSVEQNFTVAFKIHGVAKDDFSHRTQLWLEEFGIGHLGSRFPSELSGGQRQRAALARTLALGANLLLLDEPLTAIDELQRERLQVHLNKVFIATTMTSVIVTHSIEEAALLADKVFIIKDSAPIREITVLNNPLPALERDRASRMFLEFTTDIRGQLAS